MSNRADSAFQGTCVWRAPWRVRRRDITGSCRMPALAYETLDLSEDLPGVRGTHPRLGEP
jgi:hypothetical protein